MENKPNYYAIIPAKVRYDKRLCPNAKLLYGEISALANEKGYCFASNSYFSELFAVGERSITGWIAQLCEYNYITSKMIYIDGTKEILERRLYLADALPPIENIFYTPRKNIPDPHRKNFPYPVAKMCEDNNTRINNTVVNNKKENIKRKNVFTKPSVDEVKAYCLERNNGIDAAYFVDYYESKGWMIGKTPMKDWRSAVRTFERNSKAFGSQPRSGSAFVRPTNDAFTGKKGGILS